MHAIFGLFNMQGVFALILFIFLALRFLNYVINLV